MARPGKKPVKPIAEVIAERERQRQENFQKRAKKLKIIVKSLDALNAQFLLLDQRNLSAFVREHNIKLHEIEPLKAKLREIARQ